MTCYITIFTARSLETKSHRCILLDKKSLLWLKIIKGANEKKLRERLCHCFGEKEQQSVISPQIALLNSLLLKRLRIMMLRTPSGLVDEYFIFSFSTIVGDKKIDLLHFSNLSFNFFIETFYLSVIVKCNAFTLLEYTLQKNDSNLPSNQSIGNLIIYSIKKELFQSCSINIQSSAWQI